MFTIAAGAIVFLYTPAELVYAPVVQGGKVWGD